MSNGDKLFRLLWILSLLAYAVLFVGLFLLAIEPFFYGLEGLIWFYVLVGLVYFAVFGWFVSIGTTSGVLVCYLLIIRRKDAALTTRRSASIIALTSAIAFAISYKIVPLIIPVP